MSAGFNPMRWDCGRSGCFNQKRRPKIEIFADCLPGRIGFTDVDATVEINRHFLFLEFKAGPHLPTGQRIYFEQLTRVAELHVAQATGLETNRNVRPLVIRPVTRSEWALTRRVCSAIR